MVVGIDTYHEATQGRRSVGGMVCSVNSSCTRWYSRVCFQQAGQELIDGLKVCFTAALRKYHEVSVLVDMLCKTHKFVCRICLRGSPEFREIDFVWN